MLLSIGNISITALGFIAMDIIVLLNFCTIRFIWRRNENISLDIILLTLLIIFNTTGGLLPDERLPGSYFIQMTFSYAVGFLTPCYFPYYVYRRFGIESMQFHVKKGVFFFLVCPLVIFSVVFYFTGSLEVPKRLLVIPTIYAFWVIISLIQGIMRRVGSHRCPSRTLELMLLFGCLIPWVSLPLMAYLNVSHPIKVAVTNVGFLLLISFHFKDNILELRLKNSSLYNSIREIKLLKNALLRKNNIEIQEIRQVSEEEKLRLKAEEFKLTNREREIVVLIAKGYTYEQVAKELFISERTVGKHMQNIFTKVGVNNKVALLNKLRG
ncbi:LuxR C-terminal-related transcriptional regulator [Niabella terrae]